MLQSRFNLTVQKGSTAGKAGALKGIRMGLEQILKFAAITLEQVIAGQHPSERNPLILG